LVLLLGLVFGLLVALGRAHERFCVSVRRGRALVVRGSVPAAALATLSAALGDAEEALIVGLEREEEIRLEVRGATEAQTRTIVAILGVLTPTEVARAARIGRRRWWQIVGFVELAWWMDHRDRDEPPPGPPDDPPRPSNILPFHP
jgi:hypothetical protein